VGIVKRDCKGRTSASPPRCLDTCTGIRHRHHAAVLTRPNRVDAAIVGGREVVQAA